MQFNTFERDENFFSSTNPACGHVEFIFIDNDFFPKSTFEFNRNRLSYALENTSDQIISFL